MNKYTLAKQDALDILAIDNSKVLESQKKRLRQIKATRDEVAVQAALAALKDSAKSAAVTSAGDHPNNLLHLAVHCSRLRCTVGEISDALEAAWGRHTPPIRVVQGAYSQGFQANAEEEYKQTMKVINDFADKEGRRPRILVAKMGQDGHDRGAKVIASGFADLGFDVDVGPLFATPAEVAAQAIDADVHIVGASSQG